MKVCILTHTMPRFKGDTAAPFIGELANALMEAGVDLVVLSPFDQALDQSTLPYRVVTYKYAPFNRWHTLGYSRTLRGDKKLKLDTYLMAPLLYLFGTLALLKVIKQEKIDVVSAHWIIPNGFIALLAEKITGTPFTVTIPGSDIYLGSKNKLFKMMVLASAKKAGVVISDSQHYIDQLLSLGGKPSTIEIIRYGVNIKKFQPSRKDKTLLTKFHFDEKTPIILAVGRLVAKKGFIYLIKTMPEVTKKIPGVKLLIVGDGEQRNLLESEVDRLGVKESVIFAGTISFDQLMKYYNLADVFVMPSIKDESGNIDASPVAMMEAMACGTPVVATRFSGSSDLIRPGQTGFLVEEKNSNQLAVAIINLFGNKDKNLRREVRQVAVDSFSTKSVARKYITQFKKLVSETNFE